MLECDFYFDVRLMPKDTKKKQETMEIYCGTKVKGTRDFWLQVLFINQFPQAPEYSIRAVSNLFE